MRAQRLVGTPFARPEDAVRTLMAVQAQDLRAALWALAMRSRDATEAGVEDALARRAIVRTWPMRGTLHFVAPEDARWMVALLAPPVVQRAQSRYRQLGLDAKDFARARTALERALSGGKSATRAELFAMLAKARVDPAGQRGIHVLGCLSMQGVLCIGAMRGKQPTFALLDEWVTTHRAPERDEALGELAQRYVASHGPATLADFAWWTGLRAVDARRAMEVAAPRLSHDGAHYRARGSGGRRARAPADAVRLLPVFDELTVAFKDRSASLDPAHAERTRNAIMSPTLVVNGRVEGVWSRERKRDRVVLRVEAFAKLAPRMRAALEAEAERYGRFLGTRAELVLLPQPVRVSAAPRRARP